MMVLFNKLVNKIYDTINFEGPLGKNIAKDTWCSAKASQEDKQAIKAESEEQKGFSLKMEEGENLNNVIGIKKYLFQHDKLSAGIIYNRMNQGNSLFPYDEIEEYAKKIKKGKKISNKAFEITYKKLNLYKLNEETLRKECINKGIKFINYPVTSFSKEYQNKFIRNWKKNGEKEFLSKIITPPL